MRRFTLGALSFVGACALGLFGASLWLAEQIESGAWPDWSDAE